jgi:wobble nucleotide-excising tRNase
MLERITHIKGVGLLHDANGDNFKFDKATLIYADNGRGKTTLASILRSISTGDTTLITNRKTIDGVLSQNIVMQFGSGHKVNFDNDIWSEKRPELIVFDSDFIDRNVHSGGSVNTEHRKNLLEFVLGESAVAAQVEEEKATLSSKIAKDELEKITAALSGHHLGKTLLEFENLQKIEDVDTKIIEQNTHITEAQNAASILSKALSQVIVEPTLDIEGLFSTLAFSLPNIHADAEKTVKQHIVTLGGKSSEIWLSQGQQFNDKDTCPYCGQDTSESNLIRAYQTHFNAAYNELKTKVTSIFDTISNDTVNIVENFAKALKITSAQALAWNEHIEIPPIIFEVDTTSAVLAQLRELLINLLNKKISSPAELVGNEEEKGEAFKLWSQIISQMQQVNLQIKAIIDNITTYKTKLTSYNIITLDRDLKLLQLTKIRHESTVSELFSRLTIARNKLIQEEKSKETARAKLKSSMTTTVGKYQESINGLLRKFGASFAIEGMETNFRGKAPRSDYMLSLRGKNVDVEGQSPSFATALSDGDKRTLAFAFFIASTLADHDLSKRVVVIDDPMCSLDLNRKQHTKNVLCEIYSKAEQLIILAHDKHFLNGLKKTLHNTTKSLKIDLKLKEYQLTTIANNYTNFAAIDIEKECESSGTSQTPCQIPFLS